MIEAALHDAGTALEIAPEVAPGMDRGRYVQLDMEESVLQSNAGTRLAAINEGVRSAGYAQLRPWPGIVPRKAPLDLVPANEGLSLALQQRCSVTGRWSPVPEGVIAYTGQDRALDRNQWRPAAMLTPEEMRGLEAAEATEWVRLPFGNEPQLGRSMNAAWFGVQAGRFLLSLPDNHVWTPFDLTREDRYAWVGDDGASIEWKKVYGWFGDRSRLRLYLRPRRWRWFARVVAHFLVVTPFETARNDEIFLKVWFDRPPFFPFRHEISRTVGNQLIFHEYEGAYLDYDEGIDRGWRLTRAFGELQSEIVAQQYYSLCVAYILESVEPAAITLQRVPPRNGEIVCGVGILDQGSGVESRAWAVQVKDLSSVYPQQTISTFWGDFWTV